MAEEAALIDPHNLPDVNPESSPEELQIGNITNSLQELQLKSSVDYCNFFFNDVMAVTPDPHGSASSRKADIPEDVVVEILTALPVNSLLRFESVCKQWHSIIESNWFMRQQILSNCGRNNIIVQKQHYQTAREVFVISGRKQDVRNDLSMEGIDPGYDIVGSYDGIVCLGFNIDHGTWRLCLWNPAKKEVSRLPESSELQWQGTPVEDTLIKTKFGIGFDITTDSYKIVRISLARACYEIKLLGSLVEVYNMKTGLWRTVHDGHQFPINLFQTDAVAIKNEKCLYIGETSPMEKGVIFYFDLSKETYRTIDLPDDATIPIDAALNFVKEKLTYMEWTVEKRGDDGFYIIWRMEEFGRKDSWSKIYKLKDSIIPSAYINRLYISKEGDFIMASIWGEGGSCELYVYNFATEEGSSLGDCNACFIEKYNESLVSVKRGHPLF